VITKLALVVLGRGFGFGGGLELSTRETTVGIPAYGEQGRKVRLSKAVNR